MPNYYKAAQRHWCDAEYLLTDNRLANADQLFGLCAECALKAIMTGLGMEMTPDGSRPKNKKHGHISQLWDEFITFAQNKNGSKYANMLQPAINPFSDWDVAQRYDDGTQLTPAVVELHKSATKTTREILADAELDGIV